MAFAVIDVNKLTIQAGDFCLEQASFQVPTGDYCVLMGKTGCGKTTLLEAIAGLKPVIAGTIMLGSNDVTHLHPRDRNIGYVPQDGALFYTMSVFRNLAFALEIRKQSDDKIAVRVKQLAEMLGIVPLLDRQITGLSGGEQQRVALGRALSHNPATLLLDEPLSALDDSTHDQVCQLLVNVQVQTGVTVLHVCHSQQEAQRLGQWIVRIEDGVLTTVPGDREPTPVANPADDDADENCQEPDDDPSASVESSAANNTPQA